MILTVWSVRDETSAGCKSTPPTSHTAFFFSFVLVCSISKQNASSTYNRRPSIHRSFILASSYSASTVQTLYPLVSARFRHAQSTNNKDNRNESSPSCHPCFRPNPSIPFVSIQLHKTKAPAKQKQKHQHYTTFSRELRFVL